MADAKHLGLQLRNAQTEEEKLEAVREVVGLLDDGVDVSEVFDDMLTLCVPGSLPLKRLIYHYLTSQTRANPKLTLLTINTFQSEFRSHQPTTRALALKYLSDLSLPNIGEYLCQPLIAGLTDSSPRVRRIAATGALKLFHSCPNTFFVHGMIERLLSLTDDTDATVVCNALCSLDEISQSDVESIRCNPEVAHRLLDRLAEFPGHGQCTVLQFLRKYEPISEEDLLAVLNSVDPYLQCTEPDVVFAAARLFLCQSKAFGRLIPHVRQRVAGALIDLLSWSSHDVQWLCLDALGLLLQADPSLLGPHRLALYPRAGDPQPIKISKLQLLACSANQDTAQQCLDETIAWLWDDSVSTDAAACVGLLATKHECIRMVAINQLLEVIADQSGPLKGAAVKAISRVIASHPDLAQTTVPRLLPHITHRELLDAVLFPSGTIECARWLIGEYGQLWGGTPKLLIALSESVCSASQNVGPQVRSSTLTALVKNFLKNPHSLQRPLGRLLKHIIDHEEDMRVRDRALLCYHLLKTDPKLAKDMLCGADFSAVEAYGDILIQGSVDHLFDSWPAPSLKGLRSATQNTEFVCTHSIGCQSACVLTCDGRRPTHVHAFMPNGGGSDDSIGSDSSYDSYI